jgi:hypothetical protein
MLVGMGRGVQILGCSDHGGESVPPNPMRTGSSRVAHGIGQISILMADEQKNRVKQNLGAWLRRRFMIALRSMSVGTLLKRFVQQAVKRSIHSSSPLA